MSPLVVSQRVLVVPVYENFPLQTSGDNVNWSYLEFPSRVQEMIEQFGPYTVSITAHTSTLIRTTNHSWKVAFFKSFDGKAWSSSPVDLFGAITTAGSPVQTAYTDATQMTLRMRYVLGTKNTAGTAIETAQVGLALSFEFRT